MIYYCKECGEERKPGIALCQKCRYKQRVGEYGRREAKKKKAIEDVIEKAKKSRLYDPDLNLCIIYDELGKLSDQLYILYKESPVYASIHLIIDCETQEKRQIHKSRVIKIKDFSP